MCVLTCAIQCEVLPFILSTDIFCFQSELMLSQFQWYDLFYLLFLINDPVNLSDKVPSSPRLVNPVLDSNEVLIHCHSLLYTQR